MCFAQLNGMTLDRRALKILNGMFWSTSGWRPNPSVAEEDFTYARSKGVMFDPVELTHDEAVDAARKAAAATSRRSVTQAFLSSLRSRRLDLRSALGSYAVGRHLPAHSLVKSSGSPSCSCCGAYATSGDPNILNFERIKWGGVRHTDPRYVALDLELFSAEESAGPSEDDRAIFASILETARGIGPRARLGDLAKAIYNLLSSNDAARRTLIGILGYTGILIDPDRPDFRESFVPASEREQTPYHKDDWPYPVQWWNGSHGINDAALADWFPEFC